MNDETIDAARPRALPTVAPDSAADRLLRSSLAILRDTAPSPQAARLYDEILQGRRTARDLLASAAFGEAAERGLEQWSERRREMSDHDRATEDATAERLLDERPDRPGSA